MLRIIEVLSRFVSDETGFVKQQNSLALPWTASIMIAAAVMFGGPTASEANSSWSWHAHGACYSDGACSHRCFSCQPRRWVCLHWRGDLQVQMT